VAGEDDSGALFWLLLAFLFTHAEAFTPFSDLHKWTTDKKRIAKR
jgi:hypothetical protein